MVGESNSRRRQRSAGFTIIDTILMITILGVGLSGIMAFFAASNRQALDADMTVAASVLAQERLDQVVAAKTFQGYNFIVANNYPNENLAAPFVGYTRTTTISEVDPADLLTAQPGSGLKRINIAVTWGPAANQQLQLTTLVTSW